MAKSYPKFEVDTKKINDATQKLKDAVLKVSLGAQDASSQFVKLANYVSVSVWDPYDHPRNNHGEFVRKGSGSFLFGLAKQAFYAKPGGGQAKYVTEPPPDFKGGIHYTLKPGDTSYGSPNSNVYVRHADGSWSNYLPGSSADKPKAQHFPAFTAAAAFFDKKVSSGDFNQIEHQPGLEIAANNLAQAEKAVSTKVAVGDTVDMAQLGMLPIGSIVDAGTVKNIEKKDDGWHLPETGAIIKVWKTDIQATVTKLGTKEMPDDWESEGGEAGPINPNMAAKPQPKAPSPTFDKATGDLEKGEKPQKVFDNVVSEIKGALDKKEEEESKLPPMGQELSEKQWKAAPDGSIANIQGDEVIKKEGKWEWADTKYEDAPKPVWEPGIKLKGKVAQPKESKPDKSKDSLVEGVKSKTVNQYGFPTSPEAMLLYLKNAPDGTRLHTEGLPPIPGKSNTDYDIVKTDGKWAYPDGMSKGTSEEWQKMMVAWPEESIDALNPKEPKEETPLEKMKKNPPVTHDDMEPWEKELLGIKDADTEVASQVSGKSPEAIKAETPKKNKLSAKDPNDAPDPDGEWTPIKGAEGGMFNNLLHVISATKGFIHPVSKESFAFQKGDKLLQHKITPESFAVMDEAGNKKFQINKLGKKYKWSPHIPKSNYKVVYTAVGDSKDQPVEQELPDGSKFIKGNDFIHPVSGKSVTINEGETLMQHNFTPNSYLVLNPDGSMKYKIDVKGNVEKAGTNLKPSNYHSIMTGKPPKEPKSVNWDNVVFELMSNAEVRQYLDDEMEEGDFFTTPKGIKWVKQQDGFWFNATHGETMGSASLTSFSATNPPPGFKSAHGVPLNKEELTDWLGSLPEGASVLTTDFSAKKGKENAFDVHIKDNHWDNMYFATVASAVKPLPKSAKMDLKFQDPPPPPKPLNNSHGFPVNGSTDEIVEYLSKSEQGDKLLVPKFDWEALKSDHGWTVQSGEVWATGFLSGVISTWSELLKEDMRIEKAPPKTNKYGAPVYDQKALEKWAKDLPIGTVVGVDNFPTGKTKAATAVKTGADEWQDEATSKYADTKTLTTAIVTNKSGQAGEFGVKKLPDTPQGQKTKAKAAKKAKVPANVAGTPNEEIDTELAFGNYYKKTYGHDLIEGLTGKDVNVAASWYQPGLFDWSAEDYTDKARLDLMAKDSFGESISNAIATIEYAKKNAGLPTATKTKATKMVKKLQELHKYHKAAQKMVNGELPDEHPVDDKFVWGNKTTWLFDMDQPKAILNKSYNETKFKLESAALGWDPFDGTNEQYKDYLSKSDSASWAMYLDPDHMKKLALHEMKAPGYILPGYQLNSYQKMASKGQFASEVSEVLKAKNGQPFKPAFITQDKEFPEQPDFMSEEQWSHVQGLLSGEVKVDFPINNLSSESGLQERFTHLGQIIPPEAAKALGGYFGQIDGSTARFVKTVQYLLKSGIWNEDAATYEDPDYGKIALTPGMEVRKNGSGATFFFPKNFEGGYVGYISDGSFARTYVYPSGKNDYSLVYTAPYKVTLKDAQIDGRSFDASDWKALESFEDTVAPGKSFSGLQLVDINHSLGGASSPVKVSQLSDKAKSLILTYPGLADIIAYKDQKGHYRVDEPTPDAPQYATEWEQTMGRPDVPDLLNDISKLKDPDDIAIALSDYYNDDLNYIYEYLTGKEWEESEDYDYIVNEIRDIIVAQQANALAAPVDSPDAPSFGTLHKLPDQGMGGMRPKLYYADDNGDKYIAKPDNKDKFRVDTEFAAVEIANMYGYNVPSADIREIDGQYSYVQFVAPADKNFYGVAPADLDDAQLADVMSGHVLDWAISQHDTHGGQILMQPNGKVLKIDLGQAYKFLGSDKLAVGYLPPGNPEAIWYDKFYKDVQSGKISQERLDKAAKAVLTKARRISTTKDNLFQQSLELAFSRRNFWPAGHDRESFTAMAMDRKHETFGDFFKFYQKLYASGGYDFKFTEDQFDQNTLSGTNAHLSPTPEFVAQVKHVKGHGKALFMASPEIEDAHALFFTSETKAGTKESLHGDLKIRTQGDAVIKAWINAQGVTTAAEPSADLTEAKSGFDTKTTSAMQNLVSFAKTVSHHQSDGQYNQGTVSSAQASKLDVESKLSAIEQGLGEDPLYRHPDFQTGHQQWAWTEWAQDYIQSYNDVQEAMQTSQKAPLIDSSISYAPPKGIEVTKDLKAVETVTFDGDTFTKYNDFTFVGEGVQISPGSYEKIKGKQGAVTKAVETKEVVKQVVAAPKYSVAKTTFKTPRYQEIASDGKLVENGSQKWHGDAYDITSSENPGITLHYMPHQYNASDKSNPGRLQIKVSNWDGDSTAIDQAMGMLNDMGIDTSPADETSLKLFYWRHLAGILRQRKLNAQEKKTAAAMDALEKKLEKMSAEDEIEARKEVFAKLWGEDIVENADWRPQISRVAQHLKPADADDEFDTTAARPYWMRPDYNVKNLKEWTNGILPSRSDSYGMEYLKSGMFAANEEKIRYLGHFGDGDGSNSPTSDREQGSGQFGFLRQGHYLSHANGIYVEPKVMGRTQNYAFKGDEFGNIETRNMKSPFDPEDLANFGSQGVGGSSNELMFKYGLSTWDDIAIIQVSSQTVKQQLVDAFKKAGLTFVRGIAVEERIVTSKSEAQKVMEKIWAQAEKEQADKQDG